MSEASLCGNGELLRIVETWVIEVAFSMHLQIRDKRIPVRHRTRSSPSVQVYAGQSKGGWNQDCGCLAVWAKGLAIQSQFGIEVAWPSALENCADRGLIHAKLGLRTVEDWGRAR